MGSHSVVRRAEQNVKAPQHLAVQAQVGMARCAAVQQFAHGLPHLSQ